MSKCGAPEGCLFVFAIQGRSAETFFALGHIRQYLWNFLYDKLSVERNSNISCNGILLTAWRRTENLI